jgi:hypothetical protein
VQPEWFYKGNGTPPWRPGAPLTSPAFALDGGEEPEIAGIYVIGPTARPSASASRWPTSSPTM